ncbi:potassium voltage-gated channel subfamily C member 1 [Pimephales promelas]|uniref:potassium voltage-gated channel subfamily C member 1 n=1 Tax=Pimephales promelas TaxID=90988 RepID=UPI001955D06A|nr:potassium voltage-gated channel subfamily C member 1 [Pimephales promelas]XP_039541062.1 potassium voltage-gated channel subfamily C member 1 [Pimephales promelas]KAG1944366.1 potassium voltage-gated channel subfamily C [Pimephales promelas]
MSSVGVSSLGASEGSSDKIVINVGGVKHETHKSTLMTLPGSRLAQLVDTEKPPSELFFDRHPELFSHVLQYYRSGKLHYPTTCCSVMLEEEFDFWGISGTDVEPCCWAAFQQHRDAVEALAQIDPSVTENDQSGHTRAWQPKIWALFDNPLSSTGATVTAVVSMFFILLSITAFCLQSYLDRKPPYVFGVSVDNSSEYQTENPSAPRALDAVELVCSLWFVFEFVMRAVSCPSKLSFIMNVMNIVDVLALFPWFFRWCSGSFCFQALGFLHVMRCIRVFRVFKLMRYVFSVRVLEHTLRASATALCTLPLILFCCTLIFGTMIYYAEFNTTDYQSQFKDIPYSFWWAVITLTTVGYGDMYPEESKGKCVAVLCAMVGILLIILPVPIIINNFIKFNSLLKTKDSMPRRKEKRVHASTA